MNVNLGADMLRKSAGIIEERHASYGPPTTNFANIARLWTAWLNSRYGELATLKLDSVDVAVMNGLIKDARLIETPDHFDSWLDKAGYAACGLEVASKPKEEVGWRTEPFLPVEQETTGPIRSALWNRTQHDNGCAVVWMTGADCTCGLDLSKQTNKVE